MLSTEYLRMSIAPSTWDVCGCCPDLVPTSVGLLSHCASSSVSWFRLGKLDMAFEELPATIENGWSSAFPSAADATHEDN
ncbi:hypothetical protein M758_8G073400 [Ceratodon purpureus]|uniref:Uncharacterized protein n=1 Tax=Ceratodon purpureus TaxID=3225 RepID=A0A8T0H106_CERPU|nr:hypothetical protein KC19_8G078700 [Ceratodon purpureus]KAG0564045.1 hypothetical protein KC19_8G078800 [Ceratodon purpureus]KAG0608038.1 hypothetical protein M758_8G073400 [Ceratodon purpureus]